MSKNMTRKGLAFGAGTALLATGLVGLPAQAASGDLTLSPTTGTGFTVFNTDTMSVTVTQNPFLNADNQNLGYLISNPDQHTLLLDFNLTGNTDETIDIIGIKADGSTVVEANDLNINDTANDTGDFVVDFAFTSNDFVAIAINDMSDFNTNAQGYSLDISVLSDTNTAADAGGAKATAAADALTRLGYGDDNAAITVQAWLETSAATLVDAAFATASETVTFVDPDSVSVISRVERMADAVGSTPVHLAVKAHITANTALDGSVIDAGDNTGLASGTYAAGDLVLLTGQTTTAEDGVYLVGAGGAAPTRVGTVVGQIGKKIAVGSTSTADASKILTLASAADGFSETADDPASATFTSFNASGDAYLMGSLKFNVAMNLDQIDLTKWEYALESSVTADAVATAAIDLRSGIERLGDATANSNEDVATMEILTPAGYLSTNKTAAGRLMFRSVVAGDALAASATYNFQFMHTGSATAPQYKSPSFQVIAAPTSDADQVFVAANSAANTKLGTYTSGAYPLSARAGVGSLTYTAQITREDTNAAVEQANIPVMAVITAGPNWAFGQTISVTGTSETISRAGATMIVTSLTDADGQWEFTVTSTDSTSAKATYEVDVYMLDGNVWLNAEDNAATRGNTATLNVDYATAGASAITIPSNVVAASSVSLTFTIEDAFGQAIAKDALDRQYSVQLTSPDTDDIDLDVVATDGTATFTFDNYLTAGESEILTAKVYRGTATSPTFVGVETTVTLFAVAAVSGINVVKKVENVVVPYVDFITGKSTAAAPGPTSGTTYTGTVVDANGAGIPGAAVTIAAPGFQFKYGDLFYKDSVTLAATSAGTFSVDFWTHKASAAGQNITVTAGDKSATTLVTSKVNDANGGLSAANLKFSWSVPSQPVMNTTYAVVATVTDVWGNPIKGAEVKFSGFAAAQFNAAATATRVTGADGTATAYLRSIKDVDGLAAINAQLVKVDQDGGGAADVTNLTTTFTTNVATTSWDETAWNDELDAQITFLTAAPAAATEGKVNVGSFNGKLVVYALGLDGARITWKVGGNWGQDFAVGDALNRFDRLTPRAGVTLTVDIYVDGVKRLTKSVLTR